MVHEHPELEMNKTVGKVHIIEDVAIMHTGYSTEIIRRKRFERNWPLMCRDREKYPDRILGKFLWMRDLCHFNRYSYERTGSIQADMYARAKDVIAKWHELIESDHIRMVVDSLPYLTEAVDLVTGGRGIQYTVDMAASKLNGGVQLPRHPVQAMFEKKEDIERLNAMLLDYNTKNFEDRYFG